MRIDGNLNVHQRTSRFCSDENNNSCEQEQKKHWKD
ncbi:hypothetical protein T06_8960 [Trichinella sp. T6]|nr:hypothetical protein T06_8960 [Trichinella sp. T6]